MKPLLLSLLLLTTGLASIQAGDMTERIDQATAILSAKQGSMHPIPQSLLDYADGVAIFKLTQAGFVIGGSGGQGILIARLAPAGPPPLPPAATLPPAAPASTTESSTTAIQSDGTVVQQTVTTTVTPPASPSTPETSAELVDPALPPPPPTPAPPIRHWSAPSAFNLAGGSFGAQIGASKEYYIILLKGSEAIDLFTNPGNVSWDASAKGLVGNTSDGVGINDLLKQKIIIYRSTEGVYGGATMAGTSISLNEKVNHQTYGPEGSVRRILSGEIPFPPGMEPLIQLLNGQQP